MATMVQNPPPMNSGVRGPAPGGGEMAGTGPPQGYQPRQHFHHHRHSRPHHHHHHPNFNHHHRQHHNHHQPPSYSAAVPMIFPQPGGGSVTSTNYFKQINIIPGLDKDNSIVDTGYFLIFILCYPFSFQSNKNNFFQY